ncbi:myosin XVIII, partial [Paragonimus westermani]
MSFQIINMRSLTTDFFISNWTNSFHSYPLAHIPWLPPPTDSPFRVRLVQDPKHGFGILLRRGTYHERLGLSSTGEFLEVRRPALYAEPGSMGICRVGLLPGDRLIALNNTDVQSFVRADVVALIRSSGDCITLTVKPCPEMLEFSYRTVATQCNISDELAATILLETADTDDPTMPETTHLRRASQLEVRSQVLKVGGLKNLSEHILETLANMYVSHADSCESFSPTFVESWKHHRSTPNGPHSRSDHLDMASEKVEVPVWLLVRDGYKPATLLNTLPDNRCRILLLPERQEMEVDARDLERANPSSFDRIEDVADLRYSNECSVTHTLVQRFGSGQVYTYAAGQNLLAINPMVPLNIFTEGVMDLFTGAEHRRDMPPHVFSVAQLTLSRLSRSVAATQYRPRQLDAPFNANNTDSQNNHQYDAHTPCCQAICLSGRSGSGKTRASLNLLSYLLHQSNRTMAAKLQQDEHTLFSSACRRLTTERLRAMFNMLDAFTCARIMLNTNANRAMRLFSMEFTDLNAVKHAALGLSKTTGSPSLVVTGLTTRLLLFERTRVTERPDGEPNFHVFYYFLSGLDQRSRLSTFTFARRLPKDQSKVMLLIPLNRDTYPQAPEDKEAACNHWQQLCLDAQLLGFNMDDEWMSIARLLAIIYHLGCAGCVDQPQANDSILNGHSESAVHSAESSFKHLESAQRAAHLLGCSLDSLTTAVFGLVDGTGRTASESLCGFVQGLYQTTVDIVLMLINRCLSSDSSSSVSSEHNPSVCAQLLLCDPPGLQAPSPGAHISSRSAPSTLATYSDLVINYANERLSHLFHETGLGLIHFRMKESTIDSITSPGLFWLIEEAASSGNFERIYKKLHDVYQNEKNSTKNRGHPARICVNLIRAQLRGLNLIAILDEARSSFPDRITLSDFRHRYYSLISKSVLKRTGKCDNSQ